MCPDHELVSAYIDGEVPSPWSERLEEHLAACHDCAALASRYASLRKLTRADALAGEAESLARGKERLEALLAGLPPSTESATGAPLPARSRSLGLASRRAWERSIKLPLPLAAAAAILVLLLGGATALLALRPSSGAFIQTVASGELSPPQAQPASMEELLRYLDSSDHQVTLTINLPSGTTFGSAGKPVIMRSPQATIRGTNVGGSSP